MELLHIGHCIFGDEYAIVAANCSVEVLAFGNSEPTAIYGHVKLNGDVIWQSAWRNASFPRGRGVNVMLVNPFSCSLQQPVSNYDTYSCGAAATQLSDYLQQVDHGSIIVAVSADEPTANLANALSTMSEMGAHVCDVQWRGAFGFVAQKDFPEKTVLRKVTTHQVAAWMQPHFRVVVTGSRKVCV